VLKQFAANFAAQLQTLQTAVAPAGAAGSEAGTPAAASAAPGPKPINAFALVWAIIKDWLRSLFAAKRA
jgi:hypothetical protein